MMSSMVHVTFLIVTAVGGVEAAPKPKDTAINKVAENINVIENDNEVSSRPRTSAAEDKFEVQEATTVICPPGYESVEIYCYKINLQQGQQRQHQDICFQSGGYLLQIGTSQENAALVKYMRSLNFDVTKPGNFFIGLVQVHWGTDRWTHYAWISLWELQYTNWAPNYPYDNPCAFVISSGNEIGKIGDTYCELLFGGICEADPLYTLS